MARDLEGVLDLTQDLRLAEHERVERRGDAEQVAHRRSTGVTVEVRVNARRLAFERKHAGVADRTEVDTRCAGRNQLDAIAGRNQERFRRGAALHQLVEERRNPLFLQRQTLADVDRRGLVREPDHRDHQTGTRTTYTSITSSTQPTPASVPQAARLPLQPTRRRAISTTPSTSQLV